MLNNVVKMSVLLSFSLMVLTPPAFAEAPASCDSEACIKIQKDPWVATGLNLIPFGVGSYHQGDQVGGTVIAAIDAASFLAIVAPFTFSRTLMSGGGWGALIVMGYGFMGILLGRIVGFTLPWFHYAAYENQLTEPAIIGYSSAEPAPMLVHYQWAF
jgi:hypothetical protein